MLSIAYGIKYNGGNGCTVGSVDDGNDESSGDVRSGSQNRDFKIVVYGKRLISRNFFVIKSRSRTVKCSSYTIY